MSLCCWSTRQQCHKRQPAVPTLVVHRQEMTIYKGEGDSQSSIVEMQQCPSLVEWGREVDADEAVLRI